MTDGAPVSRRGRTPLAEIAVRGQAEQAGLQLQEHQGKFSTRCPWHGEGAEPLVIDPSINTFSCATCGASGGPIEWVMRQEGVSRAHAIELLLQQEEEHLAVPELADQALLQRVVGFYHHVRKRSPDCPRLPRGSAGSTPPRLIDTFRLGLANRTLGYKLPPLWPQGGGRAARAAPAAGHLPGEWPRAPRGLADHSNPRRRRERPRPLRPEGHRQPAPGRRCTSTSSTAPPVLWNATALAATHEVILADSILNAMTFWVAGFRNVVAPALPLSITEGHVALLPGARSHRGPLALRQTDAGTSVTMKVEQQLRAVGIDVLARCLPEGDGRE